MTFQCDPCVCPEQHYRDSETWKKAVITLLCKIWNILGGTSGATGLAQFDALTAVGHAAIGVAYSAGAAVLAGTRMVVLDNQTNGDVMVSMDGGMTDTYHLKGGDKLVLNLVALGVLAGALVIQLKDGTSGPTTGTFYIYSVR